MSDNDTNLMRGDNSSKNPSEAEGQVVATQAPDQGTKHEAQSIEVQENVDLGPLPSQGDAQHALRNESELEAGCDLAFIGSWAFNKTNDAEDLQKFEHRPER